MLQHQACSPYKRCLGGVVLRQRGTSGHQFRRKPSSSCFVEKTGELLQPALTIEPESSEDEEEGKGELPAPPAALSPQGTPWLVATTRKESSIKNFEAANEGYQGRRFAPPTVAPSPPPPSSVPFPLPASENGRADVGEAPPSLPSPLPSSSGTSSSSMQASSSFSESFLSARRPKELTIDNKTQPLPRTDPPSPSLSPSSKKKRGALSPGINIQRGLMCIALGLAVQFLCPRPAVDPKAWTLFSIFTTTIAGLVLEPLPVSPWSLICLCALLISKASSFDIIMKGFQSESVWLIVIAFFFARSFEKSGLGERVANFFVAANSSGNTLGLAYSLSFAEALVAPALPSSTARAGGIFMPVIKVVSRSAGSDPDESSRRRMGSFLVHAMCQSSSQSSALFLTGAAQNLLAMSIATQMGVKIPDQWMTWFIGASVPALLGLLMIPLIVHKLHPPAIKCDPDAPRMARERLVAMGKMSRNEIVTLSVLMGAVVLWVMGDGLGISAVTTAMIALSTLLASGVLSWTDCLSHRTAWDVLLWFSILVGMCSALAQGGVITAFADQAKIALDAMKLHWMGVFAILHVGYFTCHYVFASQVGHVGALYGAFLAMMMAAGVPTTLAALSLGYCSNLFGTISHYASGPATVYYSSGYIEIKEVMVIGGLLGLRSLLIWGVVGMAWWKFLGWW